MHACCHLYCQTLQRQPRRGSKNVPTNHVVFTLFPFRRRRRKKKRKKATHNTTQHNTTQHNTERKTKAKNKRAKKVNNQKVLLFVRRKKEDTQDNKLPSGNLKKLRLVVQSQLDQERINQLNFVVHSTGHTLHKAGTHRYRRQVV